jgi:hypothetical protein
MRILFHIALILSLLYLPWWAGAIVLVSACFLLEKFYEALLYGILADALYGTSYGMHGFAYAASLFALIVFSFAAFIRNRLVW